MGVNCKIAIIGAGNMALAHIPAFQDISGVEVLGIFSRTAEKAEAIAVRFHIPLVCDSIKTLYEKTKAQLVVVTVNELSMREVAIACMEYPWAIFLEKPTGCNLEEAVMISKESEKKKARIIVGLNRRFLSSTQRVLAALENIEENIVVSIQDNQSLAIAKQHGHPDRVLKYWMYANSVHLIDYFTLFARGNIVNIDTSSTQDYLKNFIVSHIQYSNGDEGVYQAYWDSPGPWSVSVACREKKWELQPLEFVTCYTLGSRNRIEFAMDEVDKQFKPGFRLQAEQAVLYAMGKKSACPTFAENIKTVHLIYQLYKI